MIHGVRDFARALLTALILAVTCAAAQSTEPLTSPYQAAAPQGVSAPTAQPGALSAGPTGPQINVAEITRRANQDVGVDIETTITGWQRELDRLETDLRRPRLRYSELNDLRNASLAFLRFSPTKRQRLSGSRKRCAKNGNTTGRMMPMVGRFRIPMINRLTRPIS